MRTAILVSLLVVFVTMATAQKVKSWTEWSKKDVEKILNDSAWGQTQSEGEEARQQSTSAITATTAARREDTNIAAASRVESGEVKPSTLVKYRVRFLSAKPVRAAFARTVMLAQTQPAEDLTGQLQGFVDRSFADYIVVSVGVEVQDERRGTALMKAFTTATTESLQKDVYLERKDGKKLFLMEYRVPTNDGLGAKFVFPRAVDGQPFLGENDSVQFFAHINERLKLNTRYKLSEMLYEGKLEY